MSKNNKDKKKNSGPAALHLALPATSANLGPAFDAAALAMDLYITIDARSAPSFTIMATGRDPEICESVENHLILTTYREILQAQGAKVIPLFLRIKNDIPIGKGCGSSAAARLAGIALANHFGRLRWTDAQIIGEASRREHHSDNASACWMGGLTVARISGDAEAQVVRIRPKGKWPLLLAIPDQALSTEKARRVLPAEYSRADAVANIQNSMLLLAAFTQGRHDLLESALEDRIPSLTALRSALCSRVCRNWRGSQACWVRPLVALVHRSSFSSILAPPRRKREGPLPPISPAGDSAPSCSLSPSPHVGRA